MDAGRRRETLGSETKDFITRGATGSRSFTFKSVSLDLQVPWEGLGPGDAALPEEFLV